MSNAKHIYSIANNHVQTVQVCIDRLHELGAKRATQIIDGKAAKVGQSGRQPEVMTKALRSLSAKRDGLRI